MWRGCEEGIGAVINEAIGTRRFENTVVEGGDCLEFGPGSSTGPGEGASRTLAEHGKWIIGRDGRLI